MTESASGNVVPVEDLYILAEVGQIYYVRGETEKAEKVFRGALVLAPEDPTLKYLYGTVCSALKRYDEALACYEVALNKNPKASPVLLNKAQALLSLDRKAEAIQIFKSLIEGEEATPAVRKNAEAMLKFAETGEIPAAPEEEQK